MSHYLTWCKITQLKYREFYVTTNCEYSTESEWTGVLKKAKLQNKTILAIKLLSLKERRWNKENIFLSDVSCFFNLDNKRK
jgi:hypothetical protein